MTFNCTTNYNNHCLTIMSEIVVNMDGGVGGSWKELTEEEEAASLEITVDELRQRKSNPVPLKKLPHQRLHGL